MSVAGGTGFGTSPRTRVSPVIKNSFVAGLLLITSLVVTAYVLKPLANWSFQFVNPVV